MARRVNTKFLIILTLVVGGGAVAALFAREVLFKKDPDALVAQSDAALQQGNLDESIRLLQQAVGAKPSDPTLRVRLGDLQVQLAGRDNDAIRRALAAWNSALEVDPAHMPALERLISVYRQIVQVSPQAHNFSELKRLAEKAVAIQPDNHAFRGLIHQAVIEPWAAHGYPTSDQSIDEAVAGLTELAEKDPAGAAYPYWIARAKLFRATTQPESVRRQLRDESIKLFDDALKAQPENASMHWRAAQIHGMAAALEREKPAREQRMTQMRTLAQKARELSKPTDADFVDIQVLNAELAAQSGDLNAGNEIMKALAEARPNDQAVRLAQARMLGRDPRRRAEAIRILEQPVVNVTFGPENALRDLEVATRVQLLELKTGVINEITDPEQKKAAITEAEGILTDLQRRIGEPPLLLRLRGQLLLAKGQPVQAITTLEQARDVAQHEGQATDYELLFTLARAYIQQGQSGLAEPLLQNIIRAAPDHALSRLMLSELLLQRNDIAGAEYQLRMLKEQGAPPEQIRNFEIAIAQSKADKTTVDREYGTMPEETPPQMVRKAQIAAATNNRADALRLFEKARAADPKSVNPAVLAVLYLAEKQRDQAIEVVETALKDDPENRSLRLLSEQLKIENPTQQQVLDIRRKIAESIPDEFERVVALFDIERDGGNTDAALANIRRAAELKPDDVNIQNQLFAFHLQQQDWAAAERLAEQLGRDNRDQANGLLYRYQLAMAQGKVDQGVELARQLVRDLPSFAQSHLALAQSRQRQGQFRQAVDAYQKVLERQRTNMDAYRGLIACFYALQQPDDAARYIEEGRNVRPNDPYFAEARLEHAERFGNPADALAAREEAARQNPDDAAAIARLGRVYQASARYAAARNNEAAAKSAMEKARATFAGAIQKWPDELAFYASLAEAQVALGDAAGAEKTIRQTLTRDAWKDKPQPHQLLAEYLARVGRIPDAKAEMRQAMLKAQGDVNVRLQLAMFLAQAGDVDAALEELQAAGDDPRVESARIEILLNAGRAKEAEEALNAAIAARPESANLKAQLAMLYAATKRSDEALARIDEALSKDPENAIALLTKGRIELARSQADKAVETLEKVRSQLPKNVEVRATLAQAYRQIGNADAAVRELEAAVEAQPLNKGLRLQLHDTLASARPPRWVEAENKLREARQMPQFAEDPELMLAEAAMWRARGQFAKSLAAAREAMKAVPDHPVIQSNYFDILLASREYKQVLAETEPLTSKEQVPAWVYQVRAVAHKGNGDKAAALAEYEKALATPDAQKMPEIQARLISSMARELGVDEAIRRMGDKIETQPTWQLLALQLYQAGGRYDEAVRLLEKMEPTHKELPEPQQKQYLRLAGLIYSAAKPMPQPQKALDAYVSLLQMEPDSLDVLNNLACLLIDTMRPADPNRAFTYSQRAIDLMNQRGQIQPLIQDTHGWVMVHIPQRQEQGTNLLADVVARDPDFPDVFYHLGVAYMMQNQPQRAIPQFERAKAMIEQFEQKGTTQYADLKSQVESELTKAQALVRDAQASGNGR
jgi:cellulose synthase operon protein C